MPLYELIIYYLGINLLALYTLNSALQLFLKPNHHLSNRIKGIPYCFYAFIGTLTYFQSIIPPINIAIQLILVYIIVSINFAGSKKNKISISCIWVMFMMISEVLVGAFYAWILSKSMYTVVFNETTKMIASIIHALLILIIAKAGHLIKKNRIGLKKLSIYDSLYVSIIPLCSVLILHLFTTMSMAFSIGEHTVVVACILVIFINVFFFVIFEKLRVSERLKYENALLKNQRDYFVQLEENAHDAFKKIYKIKHDLKYQLLYLKAKTEENSIESLEEAKSFLNTLIADTMADSMTEYTQNKSLNRLLNFKLFDIKKFDFEIDIKVAIRQDTYIDEVSLYTILGNAIDNAVRNFDSSNSSMKNLVIRIIDDHDNLFIRIANPYNKKLRFKNGLPLTDKRNKELHGFGLGSIKELVEQKNGHFKMTSKENIFVLEVLLYDEIKTRNSDLA